MIDWVTAHCPLDEFLEEEQRRMVLMTDRIMRYNPMTGDMVYETAAWDSVRSDSHSIVVRVTHTELWFQGSPARCIGDGDAVFSSGPSAAEDLVGCVARMAAFVGCQLCLSRVPIPGSWDVTRVDVTRNFLLDSRAEVRQMLIYLRNAEGGRLRVTNQAGDSVYWNATSRYIKGKAYAKGPQLVAMQKKRDYHGREYTAEEITLADRILRLELTLFCRQWKKNWQLEDWTKITPTRLDEAWQDYFGRFIGQTIMNDEELRQRIQSVSPTLGQAKAAYTAWYLIKSMGYEMARESMSQSTWYRNLRNLKLAGLKVTDLGNGKVIPFRVQKVVSGHQVASWAELRRVA